MNTLFFRLLKHEDKAVALSEALDALCQGRVRNAVVHAVDPASFRQVPGAPFAYWVSERMRRLFTELPRFEGEGRTVKQGLATADDFRFVRAWWEVPPSRILDGTNGPDWKDNTVAFRDWCRQRTYTGKRWVPFAKGGAYSPYYADLHLVVNWEWDEEEIRYWICERYKYLAGKWEWVVKNTDFYFRGYPPVFAKVYPIQTGANKAVLRTHTERTSCADSGTGWGDGVNGRKLCRKRAWAL